MTNWVRKMSNGELVLQDLMCVYTRRRPRSIITYRAFMCPDTRNGVKIWLVWQEYRTDFEDPTVEFGNEGDAFSYFLHLISNWDGYDKDTFDRIIKFKRKALKRRTTVPV